MPNTYPDAKPGSQIHLMVDAAIKVLTAAGEPLSTAQLITGIDAGMPVRLFPGVSKRISRFTGIFAKEKHSEHPRITQGADGRWSPQVRPDPTITKPRTRRPPERLADPAEVEACREKLGLDPYEFSEALGLAKTSYRGMLRDGKISKTVGLAAEALTQRLHVTKLAFLVRMTNDGKPTVTLVDDARGTITIGDLRYLLVPV